MKTLVLCGATARRKSARQSKTRRNTAKDRPEFWKRTDLREAVELAKHAAEAGDVVTLSPACAAFDQFKNFAVRGKTFKEIVNSLT